MMLLAGLMVYEEHRDSLDLVILDMIMPGMRGEETFRRLKEMEPSVIVILASGYSLNEEAERIMRAGCRAFLQKPFGVTELTSTILNALGK